MEINQLSHLILNSEQLKDGTDESNSDRTSKLLNLFKMNGSQQQGATSSANMPETHQMILLDPSARSPFMFEFSSEALLQNCLAGNFEVVKEILENGDFNVNITRRLKYNNSVVKFNEMAAETAYNTYSGGEVPKVKIDLEITDEVSKNAYKIQYQRQTAYTIEKLNIRVSLLYLNDLPIMNSIICLPRNEARNFK